MKRKLKKEDLGNMTAHCVVPKTGGDAIYVLMVAGHPWIALP